MTQLKSFGFGISKLMSLVSKGPNTPGDEPMVQLGEEAVIVSSRQASSEEPSESDVESIAESATAPSPSTQRPRFTGYLDQSLRHEKMNKNGIYRPRGRTMTDENGAKFWRDNDDEPWSKYSLSFFFSVLSGYLPGQLAKHAYLSQLQPYIIMISERN